MLRKDSPGGSASPELAPIEADLSRRIRICRVLGIFFVIVVHLQPAGEPIPGAPLLVEVSRYFFINVLGHASVPLLSLISGYLLLGSYESRGYARYLRHRFQILYIPMVVWNLIFAASLLTVNRAGFDTMSYERLVEIGWFNAIFAVWAAPINGPLYFLRDMFVISIFAPILVRAMRVAPLPTLAAAVVLAWLNLGAPVILRPITLVYFCLGLYLRMQRIELRSLDGRLAPILLISLAFWIFGTWLVFNSNVVENVFMASGWFDQVNRVVVIVLFWATSAWIAASATLPVFEWLEKFIYLVFLSHKVFLLLLGGAFKVAFDGYATYHYLTLMAVSPFFCVAGAWALLPVIRRLRPPLQHALTGRAVPSDIRLPKLAEAGPSAPPAAGDDPSAR